MNANDFMTGKGGCQYLNPSATLTRTIEDDLEGGKQGCRFMTVMSDNTQINSISFNKNGTVIVKTDLSWMNKALPNGTPIGIQYPIVALTLNAATDSLWCWNEPL